MTLFWVTCGEILENFRKDKNKIEILEQVYCDYYFDGFNKWYLFM